MSNRFLIGIGLAFVLVFAGGIAAVIAVTSATDRVIVVDDSSSTTPAPSSTVAKFTPNFGPIASTIRPIVDASTSTASAPGPVSDADLANLAAAVKLGEATSGIVGKDVWVRELPVAQKLMKGMCDCDQRNWLVHFVQTGQEAVSGSNQYPQSMQLLAKLRRSNQDLTLNQAPR